MADELQVIEYKENYLIKIYQDEIGDSPRDWENLGKMICWHRRYNLGDKHSFKDGDAFERELFGKDEYDDLEAEFDDRFAATYDTVSSIEADAERNALRIEFKSLVWKKINDNYIVLPLNLYDHSGISISTGSSYPFNCPWDSGQVGWIYCSHEKAKAEYSDGDAIVRATEYLKQEVKTYDQYLTGEVYGFNAVWVQRDNDGEIISEEDVDSCWGFYDKDDMIAEAKSMCDYDEKERFPLLANLNLEKNND